MARERWFFAHGNQRRGPAPLSRIVESVLGQPDPRAVLVWRKGFADWTRAEDVPDVERRITPFLARRAAEEAARRTPAPPPVAAPPPPARVEVEEAKPGSPALVYGGIAAGIVVLGILAWLFWPREQPQAPPAPVPIGGTTVDNAPAVVIPAPPAGAPVATPVATPTPAPPTRPAATAPPAVAEMADRETDLPKSDLHKLRSVWAWEGDALKGTVYNGTGWRVTEIYVRVFRFVNDDFIENPRPILLVPPGGQVDAGVADLLSKVAPNRKKPGVNPHDTGAFEGRAGMRPDSFRAEIESARGYAPR